MFLSINTINTSIFSLKIIVTRIPGNCDIDFWIQRMLFLKK